MSAHGNQVGTHTEAIESPLPTANLADKKINGLKPDKDLVESWDKKVPGFGIRVSPKGRGHYASICRCGATKVWPLSGCIA
jgi:hypothetical protein